jgi:murein DD-endopeptidase MepM/ murein hydrolase activator NlpD
MLTILPVSGVRYAVKKGDTLASVAKQFKGDADEIAQFNGISNGTLAAGTEIIIPNGQEAFEPPPAKAAVKGGQASPSYSGYYTNPLPGGRRTQGLHGTNGVDLAVAGNSHAPIVAAASGDVIIAFEGGWNGGYGSYVVIKHDNGTQTLYAHMSSVNVGKGQSVNQGQVIGYVGSTGRSTGPHLHFEIRGARNPF